MSRRVFRGAQKINQIKPPLTSNSIDMASSHLEGGSRVNSATGDRLRLGMPPKMEGDSGSADETPLLLFFSGVLIPPIVAEGIACPGWWKPKTARARCVCVVCVCKR